MAITNVGGQQQTTYITGDNNNVGGTQGTGNVDNGGTSSGVGQLNGPTPPVSDALYSSLMAALHEVAPTLSSEDATALLLDAITEIQKTVNESDSSKVKIDQEKKRSQLQEKSEKLADAQKKLDDAESSKKSTSIWDKIKAAFQWISAIVQVVVGIVLCCFGVPAGAFLIASGITTAVMALDATVKAATGYGIAGNIHLSLHPDDKEGASKADLGFGISVAVIGVVIGIAGAIAGGDPSSSIQAAVNLTMAVVNTTIAIGTAAGDITTGTLNYLGTQKSAEGLKTQAEAKQLEAIMQSLDDIIDQAITRMTASGQKFAEILEALTDALKNHGDTISTAKFTA